MPAPISDEFEKAFADLAFAYINNNAPKMFDYMIGFQIVEKDEDDTKALGVFGFKIGKEWYYAPVFFLNGELKGQELLYAKSAKLFLPMEEAWIDHIINKKPITAGKSTNNSMGVLAGYVPNFKTMLDSPLSKRGSYATEYDPSGAIQGKAYLGNTFDLRGCEGMWMPLNEVHKQASENIDLVNVLKEFPDLKGQLVHRAHYYEKYASALSKFYKLEDFIETQEKEASTPEPVVVEEKPDMTQKVAFFKTDEELIQPGISTQLKKDYVKQGFAIQDIREESEKSQLYSTGIKLTNPTTPGYYQVVTLDGQLVHAYISPATESYHEGEVIVIPVGKKLDYSFRKTAEVIVLDTFFEKEGPMRQKLTQAKMDSLEGYPRKNTYFLLGADNTIVKTLSYTGDCVVSNRVKDIREVNHVWMVPKGSQVLCKPKTSTQKSIWFGDWDAITNLDLAKATGSEKIAVELVGSGYRITTGILEHTAHTKYAAMRHLVCELGLDQEDSKLLLDTTKEASYMLKRAYPYQGEYDPQAPSMHMPDVSGYDPGWGMQTSNDEMREEPVMGMLQNQGSDYGELDPETLSSMTGAADQNQKEVFDTSALSSLINTSDVNNQIDKYLKDLVVSVDRIGRILFMMYYHYETYKERYGTDELHELEDTLKNSFKTTGKLVLFLKQRSIVSDVDDQAINLSDVEHT